MEAINFVAENSLEDNSIDLTIYNVHKFRKYGLSDIKRRRDRTGLK